MAAPRQALQATAPSVDIPQIHTLRDPAGWLVSHEGRLLRLVMESFLAQYELIRGSAILKVLQGQGSLVGAKELSAAESNAVSRVMADCRGETHSVAAVLEHPRVWFPSYPQEWPAEMLHAAGELTLDIAGLVLDDGLGLKDATPFNVLFEGSRPVFIDYLSFEGRAPTESSWTPFAQFLRTFVHPLLAHVHLGLPLAPIFLGHRDGIEAEELYRVCGPVRRLLPPYFLLVTLPTWLGKWQSRRSLDDTTVYRARHQKDKEQAQFVMKALLGYLRRKLRQVRPKSSRTSGWSRYLKTEYSYTDEQFQAKETLVARAFEECRPTSLLDVGCNLGHFSRMAARAGARVVAIDGDPVVVGQTWESVRAEALDILPLVVNLARPTPAVGWNNGEQTAFLARGHEKFDAVLMLAVLHHLLVTEGIPLAEILDLAAGLTKRWVIIEYIEPEDRAFRNLCRGRDFSHVTRDHFDRQVSRRFRIVRAEQILSSHRWLYVLERL